jgi:hypothetical protein
MVELVVALGDYLVVVDPDITVAGEHVDVGARFPLSVGLAAVGVAESEVDARKFFVLEKDADHLRKAQIGAEGELADAVAVLIGVAIIPEIFFQVLAVAINGSQTGIFDRESHRRGLQVAVFAVEVVTGAGIADKSAIDGGGSRENLAGGKIGPVARADEAAGFDPVKMAIEMCGKRGAGFGFDG